MQAVERANQLQRVLMVRYLGAPVVVMKFFVVVSVCKYARLTEELRVRNALPTHANDVINFDNVRALAAP